MPSRLRHPAELAARALLALLVLGAVCAVPALAQAPDATPAASDADSSQTPDASAENVEATPRTHHLNGVSITYNRADGTFGAPTAEQARALAESFARSIDVRYPGGERVFADPGQLQTKRVQGYTMARVPASMLSAAMVKVDADGNFVRVCAEDAEAARHILDAETSEVAPRPAAPALEEK